jgi:PAS domain-containing protein
MLTTRGRDSNRPVLTDPAAPSAPVEPVEKADLSPTPGGAVDAADSTAPTPPSVPAARTAAPPPAAPTTAAVPVALDPTQVSTTSHGLGPRLLSYSMGPAAFVVLLVLRHLGLIAHLPVVTYIVVFAGVPVVSAFIEAFYRRNPTRPRLHLRVAFHTGSVTAVIYLTGWGPVVISAYAFVALENIAHSGSRTWRIATFWSLLGITIGQLGIWQGWVPSFLDLAKAETLGLMGAFVILFVIRMAGATSEQKEEAESSLRTSEERFRSLVQNSSDTTLVLGPGGVILYASPPPGPCSGANPTSSSASGPRSSSIPTTGPGSSRSWPSSCAPGPFIEPLQFRIAAPRRDVALRRSRRHRHARPLLGRGIRHQRPRHHRAQGGRGEAGPPGPARRAHRSPQPPAPGRPSPQRHRPGTAPRRSALRW